MRPTMLRILGALALVAAASTARAQEELREPMPFEGGTLTVKEADDGDKVLAFNGREITRNYVIYYDKTIEFLSGTKVALFSTGDGGNECGLAAVMVWKPQNGEVQSQIVGEDCGAPSPAITDSSIYFVPYILPGGADTVQVWTPDGGLEIAGAIAYAPQPGTDWKDLDPAKFEFIIDSMKNAAVYDAAHKLVGDKLIDVVTALQVGGTTETTASGIFYASGCVPHDCGGTDGFMAIDPHARNVYFAQQGDDPAEPTVWPELGAWPAEIKTVMLKAMLQ